MRQPTLPAVVAAVLSKDYVWFESPAGHDLNIVGIRTSDDQANSFNDWLTVSYRFGDEWRFFAFPATTDPGTFYRENPINVDGTAIVKPGQYRGAYKVGKHRGYKALQQAKPIAVYRDRDRDSTLDWTGDSGSGMYGINIHRANKSLPSGQVDRWSAGCQVLQDPDHFAFLLAMCDRSKARFGNSFTYTLIEEGDLL